MAEADVFVNRQLTIKDAFKCYDISKQTKFSSPDAKLFFVNVVSFLTDTDTRNVDVDKCSVEDNIKLNNLFKRIQTDRKRHKKQSVEKLDEVVLSRSDLSLSSRKRPVSISQSTPPLKPLTDVGSRQKYRRTEEICDTIKHEANNQKVSVNELLGIVCHRMNYHSDRSASECGKKLLYDVNKQEKLPLHAAAHLKLHNNLGRAGYQREINTFKRYGFNILPTWKDIRSYEDNVTPVIFQKDYGVEVSYTAALEITFKQIMKSLDSLPPSGDVIFSFKDGCDGSGSHSIYNQSGNKETHNIILYMFTPLKITSTDFTWFEKSACSPHSARPVMLFLGKESRENMTTVMKIHKEREELKGFQISIEGDECTRNYNVSLNGTFSMIDGKMRKLCSGLGGAWCMLCTCTRDEASGFCEEVGLEKIENGFKIDRSPEQTMEIFNDMNVDGLMTGESSSRLGVTQKPLLTENVMSMGRRTKS